MQLRTKHPENRKLNEPDLLFGDGFLKTSLN